MNFNDIAARFYTAGTKYSAAIQPYALKLFFALLLIEILVTWIQFSRRRTARCTALSRPADKASSERRIRLPNDRQCILVDECCSQEFLRDRSLSHRASRPQSAKRLEDRDQHGQTSSSTLQATQA